MLNYFSFYSVSVLRFPHFFVELGKSVFREINVFFYIDSMF